MSCPGARSLIVATLSLVARLGASSAAGGRERKGGEEATPQPRFDPSYLDAVIADDRGRPKAVPRAACLFERYAGDTAWRKRLHGTVEARPRRDLVVRWTAVVCNYDYVFDWSFRQDGSIGIAVGSTGVVNTKAVSAQTGAVVPGAIGFVQTAGELLGWHPHLHVLLADGGWLPDGSFRHLL